MTRRIACAGVLAVLFLAGCRGVGGPSQPAHPLVARIQAGAPLSDLSEVELAALEDASTRVIIGGAAMVQPLLDDIARTREENRRLVLYKVLFLTVENLPVKAQDRAGSYQAVSRTAARLARSSDPGDRYFGVLLTALPQRSRIVPATVDMLSDSDEANRGFAVAVLRQVSGRDFGFRADGPPDERAAAARRWRQWWNNNSKSEVYYQPPANPVLRGLREEYYRVSSAVGPYALRVADAEGNGIPNAVVAYSYRFMTPDGIGKAKTYRGATDAEGKALLAADSVATGMRFLGAEIIVSSMGYQKALLQVLPHFLTPNSFSIDVTLEKE